MVGVDKFVENALETFTESSDKHMVTILISSTELLDDDDDDDDVSTLIFLPPFGNDFEDNDETAVGIDTMRASPTDNSVRKRVPL